MAGSGSMFPVWLKYILIVWAFNTLITYKLTHWLADKILVGYFGFPPFWSLFILYSFAVLVILLGVDPIRRRVLHR